MMMGRVFTVLSSLVGINFLVLAGTGGALGFGNIDRVTEAQLFTCVVACFAGALVGDFIRANGARSIRKAEQHLADMEQERQLARLENRPNG